MLNSYNNIYFVGIGGIGMSSLASYCLKKGKSVAGYDQNRNSLTIKLENLGAKVQYTKNLLEIPNSFKSKDDTLIVYTPAIKQDNLILNYFNANKFKLLKRSKLLGILSYNSFCIAIAGTHGKTTTMSILTHIFYENNLNFSSFVGGIMEKYNTNFIFKGDDIVLVEADEFDRSFLTLKPNIACITSIEPDHLDIYSSYSEIFNSFSEFTTSVDSDGHILKKYDLEIPGQSFGFNKNADYHIENYSVREGSTFFDIIYKEGKCENIKFNMSGKHNVLNALAAFSVCKKMDLSDIDIKESLSSFQGVKRRFSYVLKHPKVIIDDYAHHPTEIDVVFEALNSLYQQKKIMAIFQPHLFSRTKDFMSEFANVLSKFDEVILLDIYPARELPIKGINSNKLLSKINNKNKKIIDKKDLVSGIINSKCDVVAIMGAGDIGQEISKIKNEILISNEL